ncbi:MAG: nucleoside monophosphate kinase [Gemmataceae bacterium]|nr:nucleoside monophosphate kinase [Gemmataceae bacterium]
MHKYILLGVQGSGKGTQSKRLVQEHDLVHISVGDIFRWHIQSHTKMGARIKRLVAAGQLVPDSTVEEVVRSRLNLHDWNYGFLLDGFPRNREQAEFYLESYDCDAVIHLAVPDEHVMTRITNRRLCSKCGLDYNLLAHRPNTPDVCDVCGGALVARADDKPDAIQARLRDYRTKTEPTLQMFRKRGLVVEVDATRSAEEVYQDLCRELGLGKKG